jgi:hypothetical protein
MQLNSSPLYYTGQGNFFPSSYILARPLAHMYTCGALQSNIVGTSGASLSRTWGTAKCVSGFGWVEKVQQRLVASGGSYEVGRVGSSTHIQREIPGSNVTYMR